MAKNEYMVANEMLKWEREGMFKIILIILFMFFLQLAVAQSLFKYEDGKGVCYKDDLGRTIVHKKRYSIAFTDTITSIGFVGTRKGKIVCIDNQGKELFEVYQVDNGPDYISDDLFRIVGKDHKIGFADIYGTVVVPPVFSYATSFGNGVAKVTFEGETQKQGEYHSWKSNQWFIIKRSEATIVMETQNNSFYFVQLCRELTDEGDYVKSLLVTKNDDLIANIKLPSSEDIKNFSTTIKKYRKWCVLNCLYGGGDDMYRRRFYFKCYNDDLRFVKYKAVGMHFIKNSYRKKSEKINLQPINIGDFDILPYLENTP